MSASFKLNDTEIFSELNQTVTAKNINVAASDTTTPSMCKAWAYINPTATSDTTLTKSNNGIGASYNITSVTNTTSGILVINFPDLGSSDYIVLCNSTNESYSFGNTSADRAKVIARANTNCTIWTMYDNNANGAVGGYGDYKLHIAIFR